METATINITEDMKVTKRIIRKGADNPPSKGQEVEGIYLFINLIDLIN